MLLLCKRGRGAREKYYRRLFQADTNKEPAESGVKELLLHPQILPGIEAKLVSQKVLFNNMPLQIFTPSVGSD